MKRLKALSILTLLPALLAGGACRGGGASGGRTIIAAGSTSVQPFADQWAEAFMKSHPGHVVNVQGGGSSAGIAAVRSGTCQIGMSSRDLTPEEKPGLREITVARDGIAVIVHPSNPVSGLSVDEVREIFSGRIRSWKAVGGPDREIDVCTREEGSGTRGAFQEMVMKKARIYRGAIVEDSNGTVREIVVGDPDSIGFISLGLVDRRVKALALDGVAATDPNILSGRYRLVRPFLFLVKPENEAAAAPFVDFVMSPEGQRMARDRGLIPAAAQGGAGEAPGRSAGEVRP